MEIVFLTLNPEFIFGFLNEGIIKSAVAGGILKIRCINFRDFALDKHQTVDDAPYGGGSGMLIKPEPLIRAFESIELLPRRRVVFPTPAGRVFNNRTAVELSDYEQLIFICGRYEGIDERVIEIIGPDAISIGDYVLSNGELGALVIFNAVARQIPGVLGNSESLKEESFSNNLLEYPQYTRPESYRGCRTPNVLKEGNHKLIAEWRLRESLNRTRMQRRDLLNE